MLSRESCQKAASDPLSLGVCLPNFGLILGLAAALAACAPGEQRTGGTQAQGRSTCTMANDADWVQSTLDGWSIVSSELLQLQPRPLPWIVLFDHRCAYHLAPEPERLPPDAEELSVRLSFGRESVSVYALTHDDRVLLPDGKEIPAILTASASVYDDQTKSFFVLAMPSMWRGEPEMRGVDDVDAFFRGVMAHEMVHTRQLVDIARRIEELRGQHELPTRLDDDVIQHRFLDAPGYVAAYRKERRLFEKAIEAESETERLRHLAEALAAMAKRRERYFRGDNAVYAELEQIFLAMEGSAVWAHKKLAELSPDLVHFDPDGNSSWSQDQGLALYRLIDDLVPGWQQLSFGRLPASPLELLSEALEASAGP